MQQWSQTCGLREGTRTGIFWFWESAGHLSSVGPTIKFIVVVPKHSLGPPANQPALIRASSSLSLPKPLCSVSFYLFFGLFFGVLDMREMVSIDHLASGCDKLTKELDFMIFRCIMAFFTRLLGTNKISFESLQAPFGLHPHICRQIVFGEKSICLSEGGFELLNARKSIIVIW